MTDDKNKIPSNPQQGNDMEKGTKPGGLNENSIPDFKLTPPPPPPPPSKDESKSE